jgi:hypothetical protein
VSSADWWSDVPAGTMDEASPCRVLCLPRNLWQARIVRLVRRILLIPSWEGPSADPEEKRGPCEWHQHQIDGEV